MPAPQASVIVDSARAFYEFSANQVSDQSPEASWPAFADLDGRQVQLWLLAFAATVKVSARMTDAVLSITDDLEATA
jgi:hypothetical protein